VKDTLKILEVSDNIFFEIVIEKDDETDQLINHLEDESIESRLKEEVDQSVDSTNSIEKELFLHIVSRDVIIHNTEDCESRVLMIERSQR
jgi:hypothetical protein